MNWEQLFTVSCNTRAMGKQMKFSGNTVSYNIVKAGNSLSEEVVESQYREFKKN